MITLSKKGNPVNTATAASKVVEDEYEDDFEVDDEYEDDFIDDEDAGNTATNDGNVYMSEIKRRGWKIVTLGLMNDAKRYLQM